MNGGWIRWCVSVRKLDNGDNEIRDTTRKKTAIPPPGAYVDGDIWERDEGCVFIDIFLELNGWTRKET